MMRIFLLVIFLLTGCSDDLNYPDFTWFYPGEKTYVFSESSYADELQYYIVENEDLSELKEIKVEGDIFDIRKDLDVVHQLSQSAYRYDSLTFVSIDELKLLNVLAQRYDSSYFRTGVFNRNNYLFLDKESQGTEILSDLRVVNTSFGYVFYGSGMYGKLARRTTDRSQDRTSLKYIHGSQADGLTQEYLQLKNRWEPNVGDTLIIQWVEHGMIPSEF